MNSYKDFEQEQLVGYWVKRFGFTRKDLMSHPQIDDVILLCKIRDEFVDMNNYNRKAFNRIWTFVYNGKYPLKAKHLNKLKHISEHTLRKRRRQQEQRQKLRTLRKSVNHMG